VEIEPARRGVEQARSALLANLCLRVHLPVNLAGVNYAGRGAQTTERTMAAAADAWILAFNRFGLGARPGAAVRSGDPRQALLAELSAEEGARIDRSDLLSTPKVLQAVYDDDWRRKQQRDREDAARLAALAMPAPSVAALVSPAPSDAAPPPSMMNEPRPEQQFFRAEAQARLEQACSAPIGLVERLTAFWSNHFCVSVAKSGICRAAAGAFEREAIRPYVLGRFADMLLAVERHPAMLSFLDNAQSIGPNSIAGHDNRAGFNENLAREILELHTIGVGSGYAQADVTQLATILTGWTIVGRDGRLGEPGAFAFNPNAHEPLAATVRGRLYVEDGVAQGEAALADLAREPATTEHVATKFARHFVVDAPDPALVARLAKTFRDSDGDLAALARALVADEAAWRTPAAKVRNPWELTVAAYRAFGRSPSDAGPALAALDLLGMPLWQPGGPNGFSDDSVAAWASPEGMKTRVELAARFAGQIKDAPKPTALLEDVLGQTASNATREAVARAETREQAYALLILSPEFQRR
jgi:uncharacterized protein (DUF1800 family)